MKKGSFFYSKNKGFTLIELMIVIAIIGVLAAIAIPQFSLYRQRSFNSTALSDLRNFKVTEETFFNEWQVFGYSTNGGALGAPGLVTGPGTSNVMVSDGVNGLGFSLSDHVSIYGLANAMGNAYNATAKHLSGSSTYGVDSDSEAVLRVDSYAGDPLVTGDTPAPTTPARDFGGWDLL